MKPEHRPNYDNTVTHLKEFINPREAKRIVEMSVRYLRQLEASGKVEFTTIAFRGLSGALIAPMIAMEMDKSLLAVRKVKRTGHGSNPVEGDYNAGKYIIVDDFISTGETCREIMQEIEECYSMKSLNGGALCVGVLQAYFFVHPEFKETQGYPSIFDTTITSLWYSMKTQRESYKRQVAEEESRKTEQSIARLRDRGWGQEPRCEVSMKESQWTPGMDLFRIADDAMGDLLRYAGLPKLLKAPSPMKKYVATEKTRLAKLKSDRDNFNARTPTGRQQSFPRITSSSLRNISR